MIRRLFPAVLCTVLAFVILTKGERPAGVTPGRIVFWWRFEDVPPGRWLDARLGSTHAPFTTTADAVGRHPLRTFNTRPDYYPPDTSPDFVTDVATAVLSDGTPNTHSIRLDGKKFLYTLDDKADDVISAAAHPPFTVEGMFKLAVMPGDYDGKTQVIVCKIASPATQPTTALVIESSVQLATRPTTDPTTKPTPTTTTAPTTTTPTTTTAPTTEPEYDSPTELANDHPAQPVVCYVAGRGDGLARLDHFAVGLIDAARHRQVIATRDAIRGNQWYAFAVTVTGEWADLYVSDLSPRGYVHEGSARLAAGYAVGRGRWDVGCGLIDDVHDDWFHGWIDEIKLSAGAIPPEQFLAYNVKPARPPLVAAATRPAPPLPAVKGLADPNVRLFHGIYYLYGTRDQAGYPVYTSTDLKTWTRGPTAFRMSPRGWGESRFWAPSVIAHRDKYYLFYSALGPLHDSGDRHSHRVCVARADRPEGPFTDVVAPFPLNGKAAIDPEPFIDTDGTAYLYFVSDCSENVISQIYAARLNDDLTGIVGEPVLCCQPSQVWEGSIWNEGPSVFKTADIYVMLYSGNFWHSPDYAVGFATSRSPLGPWTKNPSNPILCRYRGLKGTGGAGVVPAPDGQGLAIFFHAQGPPESKRRDTFFDRLVLTPDARLGIDLSVIPYGDH